jgi:MYXO-CTERM domain-containing protein
VKAAARPGPDDLAAALVERWCLAYTRRLPSPEAARRRDELASDLWEQRAHGRAVSAPPVAVAVSILRRTAAGIPADLSWRHGLLAARPGPGSDPAPLTRGGRPMLSNLRRNWWLVLAGLYALVEIAMGVGIALALEPDRQVNPGSVAGGSAIALGGLVIVAGLVLRRRRRVAGNALIALGSVPALPFFWMIVPTVLGLVVITAAAVDAAEERALHGAGPGRSPLAVAALVLAVAVAVALMVIGAFPIALVAAACVTLALFAGARFLRRRPA